MIELDERPGAADPLGVTLAAGVRRTGARFGGVHLVDPSESVLGLVALCGVPVDAFAPWWRIAFAVQGPMQDAIRDERLVWASSPEELARLYPRAAANLPYECAFAGRPPPPGSTLSRLTAARMTPWPYAPSQPG